MMTWLTWSNLYIALAFLSALMWLAAASVRISKTAYLVPGVGELDAILKKLRLQSQLNAVGAFLMAGSVLVQLAEFVAD